MDAKYFERDDCPFGEPYEVGCKMHSAWYLWSGSFQRSIPWDTFFKYETPLSDFVWNEVCKHFGNTPFREWEDYEKSNSEDCHVSKFLLEIELKVEQNV